MNQTPSAFVLIAIALATLATGIGSVWLAALLMRLGLGGRNGSVGPQHLLSLAAGVLLATAFMHLLPAAFEGQAEAHDLFPPLLVGRVFFFLLDRPSFGTMGTSMATPRVVRAGTAMPGLMRMRMRMRMRMAMPGVTRAGLARMSTRTGTMARARAAGRCSPGTACIALAMAS